jgi:hypothetical protein
MKKHTCTFALALWFAQASFASVIMYRADLSGPAESPPNASPGTGLATVTIDTVANTMEVQVQFTGLLGTTSASHIHCCTSVPDTGTAGVATQTPTFSGFPLGVTSGSYDQTFNLLLDSTYNSGFETPNGGTPAGAEAALLKGLAAGSAYLNIHTSVVSGGEIRGFLAVATPEPTSLGFIGIGFAAIFAGRRRIRVRRS